LCFSLSLHSANHILHIHNNNNNNNIKHYPERDPDYKFTKNLPKKCDGFTHHEIEFSCQVNSYKASLKWYRDDEEISESDDRYVINKDIIGNASLVIKRATKGDAGTYKCRIENTKLVTKCVLTVSGRRHACDEMSRM
jgi:hypothetical protein